MPPLGATDPDLHAQQLSALSQRYRPILARFFQRRIRPDSDIDDLIQEVFARLARRGDLGEIAHIEGYLFEVAANLIRERAHKLKHAAVSEQGFAARTDQEDFSPERILLGKESIERMFRALHELPERTR